MNLDLQLWLGFAVPVQPNLQQAPEVADLMERNPIGIVIVMCTVVSRANDVEDIVTVELPVHILEAGQLDRLLIRQTLIVL